MKQTSLKVLHSLFVIFLISCHSSPEIIDRTSSAAVISEDIIEDFQGIERVDTITSSRALIHWNSHPSAVGYIIKNITSSISYEITNGQQELAFVGGLIGSTEYRFEVNLVDKEGNLNNGGEQLFFTTLPSPNAPTALSLISPTTFAGSDRTPTVRVSGVTSGDNVLLYIDRFCTELVGSATALASSVDIRTSALAARNYQFHAKIIDTNLEPSRCSTAAVDYLLLPCPEGYVKAPANAILGVNEFCVMKYEAKAWQDINLNTVVDSTEIDADGCGESSCITSNWGLATHAPISAPEGHPWRKIDLQNSWNECDSLNTEITRADIDTDINTDGTYALISNLEWISISRDIELVSENWTGNSPGVGCLFRGNIGTGASCIGGNSGYDGPTPDSGAVRLDSGSASLTMMNGEIIWDFSGNVSEWVDWDLTSIGFARTITPANKAFDSNDGMPVSFFKEFIDLDTNISPGDEMFSEYLLPKHILFDNSQGIGRYLAGNNITGGAPVRSGAWNDGDNAGIYTLRLNLTAADDQEDIGFRCVFRPEL